MLARLGGSMAKGVADMNCLVTDKVRRTVKFLCAVAKGVPIVTTKWLEKVRSLEVKDWPHISLLCFRAVLKLTHCSCGISLIFRVVRLGASCLLLLSL